MEVVEPSNFMPLDSSLEDSSSNSSKPISIAAIDIGTNSTHLLIASINPLLRTFSIQIAEKSTTRLGDLDPDSGELTEQAMERVLEALKQFKQLAISYKVKQIVTAATSAVREAPNGREFLFKIKDYLDIDVDLISGAEEARLIYLGVLSGISFGKKPHIILDIGGGSTELILADENDARALTSTKIGAVRLQRDFIKTEPIPSQRLDFLRTFIQGSLEPAVEKISRRIKATEMPVLIATSGTAMAIGTLVANEEGNSSLKLQGYKLTRKQVCRLLERLLSLDPAERRKIPSLNERRSEIIVPGALILEASMRMLKVESLLLSERALREGLIVDWMLRNGFLEDRFSYQGSIRKRTVIHQADRFSVDIQRAEYVARIALDFYYYTKGILHNDSGIGRDLLWAAAMLHSCGKHINLSSYHKHSSYLIRHGELLAYSHSEHLMVAAIARYHRKSLPKKRHEVWQAIVNPEEKVIVSEMSVLLRMASALDRRPDPVIDSLDVIKKENNLIISIKPLTSIANIELEEWSLLNCSRIIKDVYNLNLTVIVKS